MYSILRITKLKTMGNVASCGQHIARTKQPPNANPAKTPENRNLLLASPDLGAEVKKRLPLKVRKDAVLAVEHLLTASPDFFKGKEKDEVHTWCKVNMAWLEERYGKENIAGAYLHMDESTPHLHAVIVPVVDGKLNAKHYFGGREKMTQMQTAYGEHIQRHFSELERGIEGSKSHHTTIGEFYATIEASERLKERRPERKGLMDLDYAKRLENHLQELERFASQNEILRRKQQEYEKTAKEAVERQKRAQKSYRQGEAVIEGLEERIEGLEKGVKRYQILLSTLTTDPDIKKVMSSKGEELQKRANKTLEEQGVTKDSKGQTMER
jgi:hypothetical protein